MRLPPPIRNLLRSSKLIRNLYYDCHLADISVFLGIGSFKHNACRVMNQFLSDKELKNELLVVSIFKDIKRCFYKYKFTPQEYFLFDLRNKNEQIRETYISDSMIMKYAADKTGRKIHDIELNDKYNFFKINKSFFKREVFKIDSCSNLKDFSEFAIRTNHIIVKPNKAALGSGVEIFTIESRQDAERIFKYLKSNQIEYIVEELIIQNEKMAEWNCSSVNTIRINSFLSNDKFNLLCPFIRTGRKGSIVDNGGQGGIFASIDKVTGIINTKGMDENGKTYVKHPDSGITYVGWQVPLWNDLIKLVEEIHREMSKHIYISWDFALTDNGWVLIEGNWGEFICQQMTNNRGLKKDFLTLLNAK